MSYAWALLEQAEHLAGRGSGRSRQANLRRAISTAYYALFHQLTEAAGSQLGSGLPMQVERSIRRACQHGEMKRICRDFAAGGAAPIRECLVGPIESELAIMAETFADLQEARHIADYDFSDRITERYAVEQIAAARHALESWDRLASQNSVNARVFLLALVIPKIASRRSP